VKIEIGNSLNGTFSGSIDESALESPEPPPTAGGAVENFLFGAPRQNRVKKGQVKGIMTPFRSAPSGLPVGFGS
jgi:hypothetical protein